MQCAIPECWREGVMAPVQVGTPDNLEPGPHSIEVTVRAGGMERAARVQFVVDEDLTRRKRERAGALALLKMEDAVPPSPPAQPAPAYAPEEPPKVIYSAGVALRKIHAVLVLGRNGSMGPTCAFMKAAATRFTHLFVAGRDSLGIVAYDHTVATLLPLTESFWEAAPARIEAIRCGGATNTGEALEAAQRELKEHEDPEAINAVLLFADHPPNSMTALWPVKPSPNGSVCTEAHDGHVPATLVGTGDLTGAIFVAAGSTQSDPLTNRPPKSCFYFSGSQYPVNYAYVPEQDLNGVSFSGTRNLERFAEGDHAGKIRLDLLENVRHAAANEVENVAESLRSGSPNPAFVYVIGFSNGGRLGPVDWLRTIANDPGGSAFRADQRSGLAIVAGDPTAFGPAFERVREDIVKHATVK